MARHPKSADIVTSTERYESWLRSQVAIQTDELDYKHAQMALRDDAFPFFRGTYYRWAEVWPTVCATCQSAPRLLCVGDLHIENFGTWRDREGRLVWGINDFDEVDELPFTNDLVRLATSAVVGAESAKFDLSPKKVCRSILTGYVAQLRSGGQPFVLEEENLELRSLATQADREPAVFWKKLTSLLKQPPAEVDEDIRSILITDLQGSNIPCEIRRRPRTGMGSLGKPRYVALAKFKGGFVAREAKSLAPPVTVLLDTSRPAVSRMMELLSRAVRCADPFLHVDGDWIVRRLAARCSRIELRHLIRVSDERLLFESMGAETANMHWGTPEAQQLILEWIEQQAAGWFENAVQAMLDCTLNDWKAWCKAYAKSKT